HIYADPSRAHTLGGGVFIAWCLAALGTVLFWCLALVSAQNLVRFVRREAKTLLMATLAATLVGWLAFESGNLWGPMAQATFVLAAFWLRVTGVQNIDIDPAEKIMGVGDFYVHVASACSGYEGIGLVVAFTAIYLWVYKNEFRFPQALLLFPLGAMCIWLLNSVRIAALVVLGAYVSPEVAVGGFHSQAGWLMFIATSLGLLWFAKRVSFFTVHAQTEKPVAGEQAVSHATNSNRHATSEQAVATLIPLVVLLAASLLTSTFSAGFDYLYPLRVVAVAAALAWVWQDLRWPKPVWSWQAIAAGLVVAVIWALMLGQTTEADNAVRQGLTTLSPSWAWLWLACRFVGAVVTVPIAEELAFRGYLLCTMSRSSNYVRGPIPLVIIAMLGSSVAFGLLHGAWLAGTVAGLIYGLLRWRSQSIIVPVIAHSVTNASLFVFAFITGRWGLL
ncbi:MAG TPA: exosortase E/protease, VPEID-CTERM system, partial [Marinagarivorans sp.]